MLGNEKLLGVVDEIFSMMLQIDAQPVDVSVQAAADADYRGCVQINGEWEGRVHLDTTEGFATDAASRMLMMSPGEVGKSDVVDTLAELTNMVGGSIKSFLPGPSKLSIPNVDAAGEIDTSNGSAPVDSLTVNCQGHPVTVSVYSGC